MLNSMLAGDFGARGGVMKRGVFYFTVLICVVLLLTGCSGSVHDAAAAGDLETLSLMLNDHPQSLSETNKLGQSALHYATTNNRLDSIEALVEADADVNSQDDTGLTALHIAAGRDYRHVLRYLVEHGADVHAVDAFGDTPLHRAAMLGAGKAVNDLLKAGARASELNRDGKTALDLARKFSHDRVANRLELVVNAD